MLRPGLSLLLPFLFSLLLVTPLQAAGYSIVEIPAPLTHAAALNNDGDVVGDSGSSQPSGAFLYRSRTGEVTQLPCQGTNCSAYAAGIDALGNIIGTNSSQGTRPQAIVWLANGGITVFSNTFFSTGSGVNNHRQAVWNSTDLAGLQSGVVSDLLDQSRIGLVPLLQCGLGFCDAQSGGAAINRLGHAVGWSSWGAQPPDPDGGGQVQSGIHAALWVNGQPTDLGALGDDTYSSANGVNDFDEVVGSSTVGSASHAFLYRRGRMRDLGSLARDPALNSDADGINDCGEIVGWSDVRVPGTASVEQRAFVTRGGRLWNLTLLLDPRSSLHGKVRLTEAVAISRNGWIAVNGYDVTTRAKHAYLLTVRKSRHEKCWHPH